MAKKSQRRTVQHERSQSGCMSGFIGIFDFRQARTTRKLLSDKKHVSRHVAAGTAPGRGTLRLTGNSDKKHQGSDGDTDNFAERGETESLKVRNSKTSVKKLIEEDMSSEQETNQETPNIGKERIRLDPDYKGNGVKSHKETKKTSKVSRDIRVQESQTSSALVTQDYYQPNLSNRLANLDIASLMEEFCNQIQHRQELHVHRESAGELFGVQECTDLVAPSHLDEVDMHLVHKHSVLQEKLAEAAKAFLNQKLVDARQCTDDEGIHQSKQLVDALDILNSNKEVLLKLLQDSNSLLVKHIQDLQYTPSEEVKQDNLIEVAKLSERAGNSRQREELGCQKEVQKHHIHNFFWKKDKSQKRNSSKESDKPQVSNRIVVLKPNTTNIQSSLTANGPSSLPQSAYSLKNHGWSGKFNSQFSLSELKKKLKHTMGENRKDQHWMDGLPHKKPNKRQDQGIAGKAGSKKITGRELPSKSNLHIERTVEPSNNGEREERRGKPTNLTITTPGYSNQSESNIYIEAKKHLEEILTVGGKDGSFSSPKSPKTLGRILSIPEYAWTPLCSPGRDGEHGFVTAQMRFSPNGSFRIVNENLWRFKPDGNTSRPSPSRKNLEILEDATNAVDSDTKLQELDSDPIQSDKLPPGSEISESICSPRQDSCPKGDTEIVEEIGVTSLEEDNLLDGLSSSDSTPAISTDTTEIKEEEASICVRADSLEGDQTSSSLCDDSSSDLLIEKIESSENINDTSERPSPVSVLEPFFEEMNSPTTSTPRAEQQIQQPQFDLEEDDCSTVVVTALDLDYHPRPSMEDRIQPYEYVKAVLQASDVNWDKLFGKYHSSELLLDPSVFDEVELLPSHHYVDKELLFDCINEVLGELYERYFGSSPVVAFISPDIRPAPTGKNIINEVWEGISWNLLPQAMPRTLDQIIGKDMEKCRTWMDIRSDAEVIGNEMADDILEDLLDDTVFDLCPQDINLS